MSAAQTKEKRARLEVAPKPGEAGKGTCKCQGKLPDDRYGILDEIIAKHKDTPGSLIPVLHEAQQLFGCLPEDVQSRIAKGLGVPESEVYGVATFYSLFSLRPKGKWTVNVCLGTACYVRGAATCLEALKKELGVDIGGTSRDGLFTLQAVRCLGACALAPVVMIGETVFARVKPEDIPKILADYAATHSSEVAAS
ncbi:MAG: NAD(P)H-dependent oxidoreductase subunit E [Bacillota bacterium]